MTPRLFTKVLATFLTVVLIAPSTFLIAPSVTRAQAQAPVPGLSVPVGDFSNWIQNSITATQSVTTSAAEYANFVNTYVLQPLAFVLSGNLMKMLTAGVIAFVIGKANGTGVPQFVVDVQKSMQTVSDGQALAYLKQVGNTRSPFSSSITSAISTNYLQNSSLAGFWAANMNTLARSSPNVPAYLAGNWSQGGVAAWFALTTQVQNNPYELHHNIESKLGTIIGPGTGGATGVRQQELSWGKGFMSWCGGKTADASNVNVEAATAYADCMSSGLNTAAECQAGSNAVLNSAAGSTGINPGDPCTNSDGTQGQIQTPGSTIKATLDKVLGGQQDQIVRMGNVGDEINGILGNIATVMNTVNFASSLLGGSNTGGLSTVGNTSSANATSRLSQFQNASGALGVTNSQIYQSAASSPLINGASMASQVTQYQNAWATIVAAANSASTTVASLASFCTAAAGTATTQLKSETNPTLQTALQTFIGASTAQAAQAQTVITTEIAPVFAKAATASAIAAAATAMVVQTQTDLSSTAGTAGSAYSADLQALQKMPPTALDVATAQGNARAMGAAVANPAGSLIVASTSSTLIDQMNLINTNAQALKASVCTYKPPVLPLLGG